MRITKASPKGINLLKLAEGFMSHPYLDGGGVPTIGFGATYYPNGTRVRMTDAPITEEWAEVMLIKMITHYEMGVDSCTRDDLTQNQFDALVSFVYNIGVNQFRSSTILKLINANPNDPKIAYQFSRWNKDNGKVVPGLVKRRARESQLYFEK